MRMTKISKIANMVKISILLVMAIFPIAMHWRIFWFPAYTFIGGVRFVAFFIVVTAVVYAIAVFIHLSRSEIEQKVFFCFIFVITLLPYIPPIYIIIFQPDLVAPGTDSMGFRLIFGLLVLAGAAFNPPVIFAYLVYKIIPADRFRRLKTEDEAEDIDDFMDSRQ